MKKLVMFIFVLLFSVSIFAQKEKMDSVKFLSASLSSGDGVLSQGLLFESSFTHGDNLVNLYLGERDLAVSYLKSFSSKLYVGPVLEYYQNLPTIGAQIIWLPMKNLSTFSWAGCSAGSPGNKLDLAKWRYLFFYQSVTYTYQNLSASGIIMEYTGWRPIIDLKYNQPIMKNIDLFGSIGYSFKDDHALLRLGITYKR